MPFKSKAQRRKFYALKGRGEMSQKTIDEWEAKTPDKIPERVKQAAFVDELEKIAARAGLKLIRRLMASGAPGAAQKAERLARTPGVLKASKPGSQIKALGGGAEAQAHLVADPTHGIAVRKLYDPLSGVASPKMVGRKMQFAKEMGEHGALAGTKGFRRTGSGGRMTFHEYAPGATGSAVGKAEAAGIKSQLQQAAGKKGWNLGDVRAANISGGKAIDVLPMRPGEILREAATPGGHKLDLAKSYLMSPSMKKQIGRHLGVDKGVATQVLGGKKLAPEVVPSIQKALRGQSVPARTKRMGQLLGGPKPKGFAQSTVASPPVRRPSPIARPRTAPTEAATVASPGPRMPKPPAFKVPKPTGAQTPTGTAIVA